MVASTKRIRRMDPRRPKAVVEDLAQLATPVEPEPVSELQRAAEAIDAQDELAGHLVDPADPYRLARLYLHLHHHHPEAPTLAMREGVFYRWTLGRWRGAGSGDLGPELTSTSRAEFERLGRVALAAHEARSETDQEGGRPPVVRTVDTRLVNNVRLNLEALVNVPGEEGPLWRGSEGPWPASEMLPFPNALVHLPSLLQERDNYRLEPSPAFFSNHGMDYDFDPLAPEPRRWLQFLEELFGSDTEARELLQEWFGYCLRADTSQQKILLLVGPTRSGKGTIGRVLTELLGETLVAGPGFATLGTQFGLEPLLGRTVALVGDARLSGRSDHAVILERLLSISGEDRVTVDRKHRPAWQGTLPTRLMLLSNELPELRDSSLALASRLLILQLRRSFQGREDPTLAHQLRSELPGILLWAIEGLRRLDQRGRFQPPASGEETLQVVRELSSPIIAFVRECCEVGTRHQVPTEDVYEAYTKWCKRRGEHPRKAVQFGRDLRGQMPKLKNRQKRKGGKRAQHYLGLRLRPEWVPYQGEGWD